MTEQMNRIERFAQDEFRSHTVNFDEDAKPMIRFYIKDSAGTIRTRSHPHFSVSEIEGYSDDQLRALLRTLCGFPNQYAVKPFSTHI